MSRAHLRVTHPRSVDTGALAPECCGPPDLHWPSTALEKPRASGRGRGSQLKGQCAQPGREGTLHSLTHPKQQRLKTRTSAPGPPAGRRLSCPHLQPRPLLILHFAKKQSKGKRGRPSFSKCLGHTSVGSGRTLGRTGRQCVLKQRPLGTWKRWVVRLGGIPELPLPGATRGREATGH